LAAILIMIFAARLYAQTEQADLKNAAALIAERSDYNKAAALLDGILAKNSKNAEAHFLKAKIFYAQEQADSALQYAENAIKLDSAKSNYHLLLGKISGGRARLETSYFSKLTAAWKSKSELQKAVKLDPGNLEARFALIDYYFEAPRIAGGSTDEAFNQARELGKTDASASHTVLADLFEMSGKLDDADKEYKLGIDAGPENLRAYLRYLLFLFHLGRWQAAEPYVMKARTISPDNVNVRYFIARLDTLQKKNFNEAEHNLKIYLDHYPEETYPAWYLAQYRLGELYELQGKQKDAARAYQQSLDLMPHFMAAHHKLQQLAKK
jgi:tetratricopeptide (TPR) repeat protein